MKLTPAQDFAKSKLYMGWLDRCSEPQFQEASKAALLQYMSEVGASAEASIRLAGAKRFLDILMSLGETEPIPERKDNVNLSYR